ncbi:putative peptidoglycan glycosyltransferase FtsW [Caldilinea sp.]|uniref:FtsW/RodA/SpoVE family cell cycle protein n=1 Tax=Caldilinea sp. TaxID=2293560 RepID=UPI002BBB3D46|nr:putative peptidoglycan glycosyltransferase FtsW [Caldilinea sp.]
MTKTARASKPKGSYDWALLSVVTILLMLGVVMVFSASYPRGMEGFDNPYYFVIRQLIWLAIGISGLIVTARIPYTFWDRWSIPLMGIALLSLLAVVLFGAERFGATRTYYQGSIQPSEPAKIVIIIYVSAWLTSKGRRIRDARAGLLPFGVLMGVVAVLIVLQPEISTAILIVATAAVMLFVAGADLKQLAAVGVVATATFFLVISYSSYAADRIQRYLDSVGNPVASDEWQVSQGVQALMRGGLFGRGLGNGLAQQTGYLPVSWSDNIYGVIGEELGLLGALFVILLFALLAYRGLRIALRAPDNFGMLLATGITTILVLQTLLNMAVIVAVSPPTGVTLPFVSYGGSSLVASLIGIGVLLSISRFSIETAPRAAQPGRYSYERVDLGRGNGRSRVSRPGRRSAARAGNYQATTPRPPSVGDGRVRRGGKRG